MRVNGEVVTELGTKITPGRDKVTFDGSLVRPPARRYYIALNKPRGVVCSRADAHAARLVTEFVELPSRPMLRPVGRLDAESVGLIFLTDDGDFLYHLTHPKYHVPKTYRAEVRGVPSPDAVGRLSRGMMLDDGPVAGAENVRVWAKKSVPAAPPSTPQSAPVVPFSRNRFARPASDNKEDSSASPADVSGEGRAEVELTIFEGRNRQVRRMLAAVGHPVTKLTRIRIGDVRLTGLAPGAWRHLTPAEVQTLMQEASPKPPSPHTTQENPSWPVPQHLKQPKAPSLPTSPRQARPARPRTS